MAGTTTERSNLAKHDSDLGYLPDKGQVPRHLQAYLGRDGIVSLIGSIFKIGVLC